MEHGRACGALSGQLAPLILSLFESDSESSTDASEDDTATSSFSSSSPSSEDDSSNSELEILLKEPLRKRQRTDDYFEEFVPSLSHEDFLAQFRIGKDQFYTLAEKMHKCDSFRRIRLDARTNIAEKHLAVFLWFVGHKACSFRDLTSRFNLSLWTVGQMIERTINFLSEMSSEVIVWPDEEEKKSAARYFHQKGLLPAAIGVIGGCDVIIDPPNREKEDYLNEDGEYCLHLQAICDHKGHFTDVFVSFPGSGHGSQMLYDSPIHTNLQALCGDYYILGDTSYPCCKYLLTPYREVSDLTPQKKMFNRKLHFCRTIIEDLFESLKERFPQLIYCRLKGVDKLDQFIRACCVLHNLSDSSDFHLKRTVGEDEREVRKTKQTVPRSRDTALGRKKRGAVCAEIAREIEETSSVRE